MKTLLIILMALALTGLQAQVTLPLDSWEGAFIGADTLIDQTTGDSILYWGYYDRNTPDFADTLVSYHYLIYRVTITPANDTSWNKKELNEYYSKVDSLTIDGTRYSGKQIMGNHYDAAWRTDDRKIARSLLKEKKVTTGW